LAIAACLAIALVPSGANGAAGLFDLALLEQNRSQIDVVQHVVERVLPRITRRTQFANKWVVNQPNVETTTLRIELFRSNATTNSNEITKTYADACVTFIPFRLVICDVHAFEVLMNRWGFDRTTDLGGRDWPSDADVPVRSMTLEEQDGVLLQLVSWVLGHEIGHMTTKGTDFKADVPSLLSDVPGRRLTQITEVLADAYVLRGSGLGDTERDDVAGFLVSALNAELRLKYCPTRDVVQQCHSVPAGVGILYDYNRVNGLNIDASKSHPEFLIRLIRLLEMLHSEGDCQSDPMCVLLRAVLVRVRAVNRH
jgi:hypothetical protein